MHFADVIASLGFVLYFRHCVA